MPRMTQFGSRFKALYHSVKLPHRRGRMVQKRERATKGQCHKELTQTNQGLPLGKRLSSGGNSDLTAFSLQLRTLPTRTSRCQSRKWQMRPCTCYQACSLRGCPGWNRPQQADVNLDGGGRVANL